VAIRRKGDQWVVEFMLKGHRVFKRLPPFASKADAADYEAALKREIFDQAVLSKQPEVTIHAAITDWLQSIEGRKAFKQTKSHAECAAQTAGADALGSIVESADRLRSRAARGRWAPGTLNRRLAVLKAVAKYAWKKGWLKDNLSGKITLVPEGAKREVYLNHGQVTALLNATPAFAKAFVGLAIYTGLRQSEVMALQPDDVGEDFIRVRDSKTGSPRLVPLVGAAKPFVAALPFTQHVRTLYGGFETAREAIGMPHLRYHDLRHTTASLLIQAGVKLYTVGEILGHKSVQTTKRYAHLALEDKREALEAAFGGITSKVRQQRRRKSA